MIYAVEAKIVSTAKDLNLKYVPPHPAQSGLWRIHHINAPTGCRALREIAFVHQGFQSTEKSGAGNVCHKAVRHKPGCPHAMVVTRKLCCCVVDVAFNRAQIFEPHCTLHTQEQFSQFRKFGNISHRY